MGTKPQGFQDVGGKDKGVGITKKRERSPKLSFVAVLSGFRWFVFCFAFVFLVGVMDLE